MVISIGNAKPVHIVRAHIKKIVFVCFKNLHVLCCPIMIIVLLTLLRVWILLQNASSQFCFRFLLFSSHNI